MAFRNSLTSWLGRCWHWRWMRVFAIYFACFVAAVTGFHVWMNARGARSWKATREMLAKEGVEMDPSKVTGALVPASENFCAIPLLEGINLVMDRDPMKGEPAARRKALEALGVPAYHATHPRPPVVTGSVLAGEPPKLEVWAEWLRKTGHAMPVTDPGHPAREVLAALSYQDAAVAEMAAAVERPRATFQSEGRSLLAAESMVDLHLTHHSTMQGLVSGFVLRSLAAAESGEPGKAHEAARITARLAEAMADEPALFGLLSASTHASLLAYGTWNLCRNHCGTEQDFHKLQRDLERINLRDSTVKAFQGEAALAIRTIFKLQRSRDKTMLGLGGGGAEGVIYQVGLMAIPRGWFEMNASAMGEWHMNYAVIPLRDHDWPAALAAQARLERTLHDLREDNWERLEMHLARSWSSSLVPRLMIRAARAQSLVDQAVIACALERHWMERGSYPERLADLARPGERPLPLDVLSASGAWMGYRREDGRYLLWSVALDGTDNDGRRGGPKTERSDYKGDWVWDFQRDSAP